MPNYRTKLESGSCYHIFNHAVGGENIFIENSNYLFFLQKFEKYMAEFLDVYAYCLMPNHFHFLIKVKEENDQFSTQISSAFRNLFTSYSHSFNKIYGRIGSRFQPRYKRLLIESNEQLLNTAIYIHCNPVLHGFVKTPSKWKYSSYNHIVTNQNIKWLNANEIVSWFNDIENFVHCHENANFSNNNSL